MKKYPNYTYHGIKKQFRTFHEEMKRKYPELSNEEQDWQGFQYFINVFYLNTSKRQFTKEGSTIKFKGFPTMRLNSKVLKNILRYFYSAHTPNVVRYHDVLQALYRSGILACVSTSYQEGSYSRLYQLNVRKMHYDGELENRLLKRMFASAALKKEFPFIKKIEDTLLENYNKLEVRDYEVFLRGMEEEEAEKQRRLIHKINKGTIRRDDINFKKERYYHPVQQLDEEIRRHCLYTREDNGDLTELHSVDIPNCQSQIASDFVWESYKDGGLDAPFDEVSDFQYFFKHMDPYLWLGSHIEGDVDKMRDTGRLLFNLLLFDYAGDKKVLRRKKVPLLDHIRYSPMRWKFEADPYAQVINMIRDRFPNIFRFFDDLKNNCGKNALHRILTQREREVRQDLILKSKENDLFVLDVHDEFITESKEFINLLLVHKGFRVHKRIDDQQIMDESYRLRSEGERERMEKLAKENMMEAIEEQKEYERANDPELDLEDIRCMVAEENGEGVEELELNSDPFTKFL